MKKQYEKPVMYIERFTLSQTIALNCGENVDLGEPMYGSKETCGWNIDGTIVFTSKPNCVELTEVFLDVCYNAPAGGNNVFAS